jgi:hypothetical protein
MRRRTVLGFVAAALLVVSSLSIVAAAGGTIAYVVPAGTVGNQDFEGALGMDFDVLKPITVTELGVFDSGSDGLNRPLTARLYDRDTTLQIATLSFGTGSTGTLVGGSRFLPLLVPITLPAGFHGTIEAEGYGSGEPNGNSLNAWTTDSGGGAIAFVGSGRWAPTPGVFPFIVDGGPANRYAAGTFVFQPALPTSKDQCKDGGWASFGLFKNQGDCVSFIATKGESPPAG